jgi:antitoxin CptB
MTRPRPPHAPPPGDPDPTATVPDDAPLGPADAPYRRLLWRSRRGLLELDLFLEPFLRDRLAGLSRPQQEAYGALLECTDPELHEWLSGRAEAPRELAGIVALIRDHARGRP